LNFRYTVKPNNKLNCFVPTKVEITEPVLLRPTLIGSLFKDNFNELPTRKHAAVVWDVPCLAQQPCHVD
jgi:hypothetical protein